MFILYTKKKIFLFVIRKCKQRIGQFIQRIDFELSCIIFWFYVTKYLFVFLVWACVVCVARSLSWGNLWPLFPFCFCFSFQITLFVPPMFIIRLSARALPCKTKHLFIYIASHFDMCNKPVKHSVFEPSYTENRELQRLISIGRPARRFISVEFAYWKQKHYDGNM